MELSLYVRAPATPDERSHWDKNMQLVLDVVTARIFPPGAASRIGCRRRADAHGLRPQRAAISLSPLDASPLALPDEVRTRVG